MWFDLICIFRMANDINHLLCVYLFIYHPFTLLFILNWTFFLSLSFEFFIYSGYKLCIRYVIYKYFLSICCSSYILLTNLWRSGVLIKSDLSILLWNYTFGGIPNLCLAQDHKDFFPKSYKTCRKTIKEYKTINFMEWNMGWSVLLPLEHLTGFGDEIMSGDNVLG